MKIAKLLCFLTLLGGMSMVYGCDDGPAENAGESIDNAADNTADAVKDATN